MDNLAISQAHIFLIFILNGIIIAFIFDLFRISRKIFKTPDWITYIEDILFWLITCLIIAYSIYTYNNGEIRLYMLIGLLVGGLTYIVTLSKYIIKIFVTIIDKIKQSIQLITKFLMFPVKILGKWGRGLILKPIYFIIINVKSNISKILQKNIKNSAKANK